MLSDVSQSTAKVFNLMKVVSSFRFCLAQHAVCMTTRIDFHVNLLIVNNKKNVFCYSLNDGLFGIDVCMGRGERDE